MMLPKYRLWCILCMLFFITSCAGSSGYMRKTESLSSPTNNKALVRFMRPSGFGFAINFNIWDGNKVIGNSVAKSQFDYLADPGSHVFVAIAENTSFLDAVLESNKTYYVLTRVGMGAWKARVEMIPVTRNSEFWDKVKEYENTLNKLEPDTVAIQSWEEKNKAKMEQVLSQYKTMKKQWPKLNNEDGR